MSSSCSGPPELGEVFTAYAPFVMRVLRRCGASDVDADDLCQDVFLVVHRKLPSFEGRSSLRTWLYGITVRVMSTHRRSARVRRERAGSPSEDLISSDDPSETAITRQALGLLDAALEALKPDKREAFALYELEQWTMREISEALGCPEATVLSRIHAARAEIRSFVSRRQRLGRMEPTVARDTRIVQRGEP